MNQQPNQNKQRNLKSLPPLPQLQRRLNPPRVGRVTPPPLLLKTNLQRMHQHHNLLIELRLNKFTPLFLSS